MTARVLIAGGGTGGHVFPMLAVGQALRQLDSDVQLLFVGTGRGLEARLVPEQGERLELLDVLPLRGGGLGGLIRGVAKAAAVLPQARRLVKDFAPDVVLSVGGYAAGPVTLAARSCGIPVTLLEPNAVAGFTNRLLTPLVSRAYLCFPEAGTGVPETKVRLTGVPLRTRFSAIQYQPSEAADVLVMGGSQGAQALNEVVPSALAACLADGIEIGRVVHQAGRGKEAPVVALYERLGLADKVEVVSFLDDVAASLAAADLVVERAGAGSLAELCAVGRAAILIPYPYAADDHQLRNAESLARAGAARCVVQSEASVERLRDELRALMGDSARRCAMAEQARLRGRPDAARAVALDLLDLATPRGEVAGRGKNRAKTTSEGSEDLQRIGTDNRLCGNMAGRVEMPS